jgi:hypothetical protein
MFATTIVFLSALAAEANPTTHVGHFEYRPDRIETGTVYHYVKSDLKGGNPARVVVFVATKSHIEVVKMEQGSRDFAYVTADFDWSTFSLSQITSWNLLPNGLYRRQAHMVFDGESHTIDIQLHGGSEQVRVEHYPFHIYNFDFLSLNYSFRHLTDPHTPFDIGIVDPTWEDQGPVMAYQGLVRIEYVGDEDYKATPCRKYRVGGPGLNGEFGWIWVDREHGHFVNVEHPWRDNPDWDSFKFELDSIEHMTLSEWHNFLDFEREALQKSLRG